MSMKANTLIVLGMSLPVITNVTGSASKSFQERQKDITVIQVLPKRSTYGDKHHMRAMSRGRDLSYVPGKVVGATIVLEGPAPQDLKTYRIVQDILMQLAIVTGKQNLSLYP